MSLYLYFLFATLIIILKVYVLAFFVSLALEMAQSFFYKNTLKNTIPEYVKNIFLASLKNSVLVIAVYVFTALLFLDFDVLGNKIQLLVFVITSLVISFFKEKYYVKKKREDYDIKIPVIYGINVIPFVQIAVTGIITFMIIALIQY